MITQQIAIRSLQHYMYCPHRWGLIEINRAWVENYFVTKANLMHERVHNPDNNYTLRGKKVYTSVPVYNDLEEYNLYGVTDCLELSKDSSGIKIEGLEDSYKINIVEYKPAMPKNDTYRRDDLMQVFAQKLCVDYVFGCDCEGSIYYADEKTRVKLPLQEKYNELNEELLMLLNNMRFHLEKGIIPQIRKKQKCSGCSFKDMCMPKTTLVDDFEKEIIKIIREST